MKLNAVKLATKTLCDLVTYIKETMAFDEEASIDRTLTLFKAKMGSQLNPLERALANDPDVAQKTREDIYQQNLERIFLLAGELQALPDTQQTTLPGGRILPKPIVDPDKLELITNGFRNDAARNLYLAAYNTALAQLQFNYDFERFPESKTEVQFHKCAKRFDLEELGF